jgi:hypothetical protein
LSSFETPVFLKILFVVGVIDNEEIVVDYEAQVAQVDLFRNQV